VLDEIGDHVTCEKIANHLLRAAGDDVIWKTSGWNHLACALIGQGKFDEAVAHAEHAVAHNQLPDNAPGFAATLERAQSRTQTTPAVASPVTKPRDPIFALLEAGDHTAVEVAARNPSPSDLCANQELLQEVRARLSDEERVIADLRADGRDWVEIAAHLGGTSNGRRMQFARALDRVAAQLGLDEPAPSS